MPHVACDDFRRQVRIDYFVFHALSPLIFLEALSSEVAPFPPRAVGGYESAMPRLNFSSRTPVEGQARSALARGVRSPRPSPLRVAGSTPLVRRRARLSLFIASTLIQHANRSHSVQGLLAVSIPRRVRSTA